MNAREIRARPLTADAFAMFGDVIEIAGRPSRAINQGTARRFDDLARLDLSAHDGEPHVCVFEAIPRSLPLAIRALERHPLSSQLFYPLQAQPFLIVVAEDGCQILADRIQAFLSSGSQGVNYKRNTWHHSLIALDHASQFLVLERAGKEPNCEEIDVTDEAVLVIR